MTRKISFISKDDFLNNIDIYFSNKNSLHDKIHPIGRTRNDVTYEHLYGYMNCLQVNENK